MTVLSWTVLAASGTNPVLSIAMFALGGILAGGAWAVREQSRVGAIVLAVLALLAVAAAVLWQVSG